MAKFQQELPNDLIKEFEELNENLENMIDDMLLSGVKVAEKNIKQNIKKSFKDSNEISSSLTFSKIYRTPSDGGKNIKVYFNGYKKQDKSFVQKRLLKGAKTKKIYGIAIPYVETYEYDGVPIALIAAAREYGTSRGERKKPFFRKSFRKQEIEQAMEKVQRKYLPKE